MGLVEPLKTTYFYVFFRLTEFVWMFFWIWTSSYDQFFRNLNTFFGARMIAIHIMPLFVVLHLYLKNKSFGDNWNFLWSVLSLNLIVQSTMHYLDTNMYFNMFPVYWIFQFIGAYFFGRTSKNIKVLGSLVIAEVMLQISYVLFRYKLDFLTIASTVMSLSIMVILILGYFERE